MKNILIGISKTLSKADDWLINRKLRLPRHQENIGWVQPILPWLVRAVIYIPIALLAIWCIYWLFWIGPGTFLSDPSRRILVPTAQPTATQRVIGDRWNTHKWLNQEEAANLRHRPNVINLAYLSPNGSAQYSQASSLILAEAPPWQRFTLPAFPQLTNASVSNLQVTLEISGQRYHLNAYQPFVHQDQPDQILIVDPTGQIWQVDVDEIGLVDLVAAQEQLPLSIPPNPNLNFTY